jgi:hypothetical protein
LSSYRAVPFSEVSECGRLDAGHYLPVHRTWEHYGRLARMAGWLVTPNDVLKAWLAGELPEEEFLKAVKTPPRRKSKIPPLGSLV